MGNGSILNIAFLENMLRRKINFVYLMLRVHGDKEARSAS